jgi:hypothetical protein
MLYPYCLFQHKQQLKKTAGEERGEGEEEAPGISLPKKCPNYKHTLKYVLE